jgi:hypothetical protein
MPEIRYETIETYDNKGNLIGTEQISYEVTDAELEKENAETVVTQLSAINDDDFTFPQLAKFVKALARLRR